MSAAVEHKTEMVRLVTTAGSFFFIFGSKRGGTTLLRLLLNSHPLIAVPNESHFISALVTGGRTLELLTSENREHILDIILTQGRFDTWSMGEDRLREIVYAAPEGTSLEELLLTIFSAESGDSADLVGDKTPEYIDHVAAIRRLFPRSKFVFLIRDPRDVADSLQTRGWEGWTHFQRGRYLNRVMTVALEHRREPNSILIKYEDLVTDPEGALARVVAFLDMTFDPTMLQFDRSAQALLTPHERDSGIHQNLARSPSPADVGKWRQKPAERYFYLESVCEASMRELNYEPVLRPPKYHRNSVVQRGYLGFLYFKVGLQLVYKAVIPKAAKEMLARSMFHSRLRSTVKR